MRGAHDLVEARALAAAVLDEPAPGGPTRSPETLERFVELRSQLPEVLGRDEREEPAARAEGGRAATCARCASH